MAACEDRVEIKVRNVLFTVVAAMLTWQLTATSASVVSDNSQRLIMMTYGNEVKEFSSFSNSRVKRQQQNPGKVDTSKHGFTSAEKVNIVHKHNDLRAIVDSPTGANMRYMTWEDDLEAMAQQWTDLCNWWHGQVESQDQWPYDWVGQNNFASTLYYDEQNAVQLWFDERQYYNYNTQACSQGECGHYTQIAWAESYRVGCGITYCPKLNQSTYPEYAYYFIVCNYGPGGNYIGEKPYIDGVSCSQCPGNSDPPAMKQCLNGTICQASITCPNIDQYCSSYSADTCVCYEYSSSGGSTSPTPRTSRPTTPSGTSSIAVMQVGGLTLVTFLLLLTSLMAS